MLNHATQPYRDLLSCLIQNITQLQILTVPGFRFVRYRMKTDVWKSCFGRKRLKFAKVRRKPKSCHFALKNLKNSSTLSCRPSKACKLICRSHPMKIALLSRKWKCSIKCSMPWNVNTHITQPRHLRLAKKPRR